MSGGGVLPQTPSHHPYQSQQSHPGYPSSSPYPGYSPGTPSSAGTGGQNTPSANRFFYNDPLTASNASVGGSLFRRSESGFHLGGHMDSPTSSSPPSLRRASFPSGGGSLIANNLPPQPPPPAPPAVPSLPASAGPLTHTQLAAPSSTNSLAGSAVPDSTLLSLQHIKNFASSHTDFASHRE